MVDSKSVWLPSGPQGSPAPRWEAVVDLAGAAEEARIWEALVVEVMVALGEVVWEWLCGEGSPWKLMGEWAGFYGARERGFDDCEDEDEKE
ncbi:MAG: hypothetical protein Q9161_007264 [Pseudevernia consocians]